MKKSFIILAMALLLTTSLISTVAAEGDKVRGDKGQGGVNQQQVMDPPPFN